jgi:hypothetical protein
MSISQNGGLAAVVVTLALLTDSAGGTLSKPTSPAQNSPTTFRRQSESRVLENEVPKHLPIVVQLYREKEKAFRQLDNEKWVRDFELEVTNSGDKPIYFIQFALVPDFGKPPTERTLALTVQYGRDQLMFFETALTAEDVPIKPGEKVLLKVVEMEAKGWDHVRQRDHWPEHWSKPKKATLFFERLNFGDGTGFDGGGGSPWPVPKRGKPGLTARRPGPKDPSIVTHHVLSRSILWLR